MGLTLEFPEGATPLDADDTAGLIPTHIITRRELNEWEFENVARGEEWAFSTRQRDILTIDFLLSLHKRLFGDTWIWAGEFRRKEVLPIGVAPEQIRVALTTLLADVNAQIEHRTWDIAETAIRFHHRLVAIHPFPDGNGRFSRTMTDLLLVQAGRDRFAWGAHLERVGDARARYIAALQAADNKDYRPLFTLIGMRSHSAVTRDEQ
jgi:Fic-DOC domain mobile mystery protein B